MNNYPNRDFYKDRVAERLKQFAQDPAYYLDKFFREVEASIWRVGVTLLGIFVVLLILTSISLADGISIGGQDASGQMKDVQTLVTTMQTIGFHWVAPLLGGGLAIFGILQIATRRIGMGILALGGGGALFAVERIANSLSHIAGN